MINILFPIFCGISVGTLTMAIMLVINYARLRKNFEELCEKHNEFVRYTITNKIRKEEENNDKN